LGVLTNSPPFDWHLINIGNYLDMKPGAPKKAMPMQGGSEAVDVTGNLK
jgi:penicillin V acylase-like amidase (Ntn superfamily)